MNIKAMGKNYFGKDRMLKGLGIAGGLAGGAIGKQLISKMLPTMPIIGRFYGALSIIAGATITAKGKKEFQKSLGTGMVVYGIIDLIVTNVPSIAKFLPSVAGPTAFMGSQGYGRSMYGSNINASRGVEVVGAQISQGMDPEIIGEDMSLEDAMEAYI